MVATPVGSNYENHTVASADIRLNVPGVILPPAGTPTASFTFSPGTPSAGTEIFFDASASQPGSGASSIVNYHWFLGDGNQGGGSQPRIDHVYGEAGQYSVTLTVTNDRGVTAQQTRTVTVTADTDLENFNFTNDDQNQVAKYISADGMSPEDAAAKWVEENPDKVEAWLG